MSTEKSTLPSSQPSNNDTNNTHSQPRPQPQSTLSSTSTPSTTKTPVTLSPDSHLDPSAYVRGTHTIKIGNNVLVHPRAHLISIHSPLTINPDSIITERSIIGGPIPASNTNTNPNPDPDPSTPSTSTTTAPTTPPPPPPSTNPTTIGTKVHIHPNVQIHSGANIGSHSIIESNATISHNITIGPHSKICAGATISRDVPGWTVVYGINGEFRRRRKPPPPQTPASSEAEGTDVVSDARNQAGTNMNADLDANAIENARLKTMAAEREATMAILKKSAAKAVAGRTKR